MKNILSYLETFANIVFSIVGALLGLRFVLRLLGANSANDLVSWIYDTSRPLIEPFENIFPTVRVEDGFVFEITTLLAMLVYAIIAALLINFIAGLAPAKKRKKK